MLDISIHIPRVGDDENMEKIKAQYIPISIHIPRVGDDEESIIEPLTDKKFQSTSPVWGMTTTAMIMFLSFCISIHIPRVGDDRYCPAV